MSGCDSTSPCASTLEGLRLVLIGRFVRQRRGELIRRLKLAGVRVCREVTPAVHLVVVGDGPWPVRKNGRMPRGLLVARILHVRQATPELIDETALALRYPDLGWTAPDTAARLTNDAPLSATIPYRDWQRARVLAELLTAGVSPRRLQRALCQLGRWFPQARTDWERLSPTWNGGRLLFRVPQGLIEANGQRVFDDAQNHADPLLLSLRTEAPRDPFNEAVDHERQGDFIAAEQAYRKLLLDDGPDADVCFNLANVLVALNQRPAALERLWQCVELSPRFSEAWHNLGIVALEVQDLETALQAFRRALELAPHFRAAQLGWQAAQRLAANGRFHGQEGDSPPG